MKNRYISSKRRHHLI